MSTNNTITLDRGETLNMSLIPVTDGVDITMDDTWSCRCYIKPSCGAKVNLSPTLSAGVFAVSYDTSTLTANSYKGDVVFIDANGERSVSKEFNLFLSGTISPVT